MDRSHLRIGWMEVESAQRGALHMDDDALAHRWLSWVVDDEAALGHLRDVVEEGAGAWAATQMSDRDIVTHASCLFARGELDIAWAPAGGPGAERVIREPEPERAPEVASTFVEFRVLDWAGRPVTRIPYTLSFGRHAFERSDTSEAPIRRDNAEPGYYQLDVAAVDAARWRVDPTPAPLPEDQELIAFKVLDRTGKPIAGVPYLLLADGEVVSAGTTDTTPVVPEENVAGRREIEVPQLARAQWRVDPAPPPDAEDVDDSVAFKVLDRAGKPVADLRYRLFRDGEALGEGITSDAPVAPGEVRPGEHEIELVQIVGASWRVEGA